MMVVSHYRQQCDYLQLAKTLRIRPDLGTPFSSVLFLEQLGYHIGYREEGTLEILHRLLTFGYPAIVAVDTGELSYWNVTTGHVVVVVGINDDRIYLNDPAVNESPLAVPVGDFLLAWQEMSFSYAVIGS